MSDQPLVSLILCVKNGMPYLPRAIASVMLQTHADIELIVQDACSTDGSTEYLRRTADAGDIRRMHVVSERDGGIGDGFGRALARCQGEIVGSIDADNMLDPQAVAVAVDVFRNHPDAAAVYGWVVQIDDRDNVLGVFKPAPFDLVSVMSCASVPPFGQSFFSRAACGADLRFDQTMATCADYDLWLRLGARPIASVPTPIGYVRTSDKSMTCDAERYEQFCADKAAALGRFLDTHAPSPLIEHLRERSIRGIHQWAAQSVLALEGETARYRAHVERAQPVGTVGVPAPA